LPTDAFAVDNSERRKSICSIIELKFLLLHPVWSIHGMEAIPDPEYMLCQRNIDEWLQQNAARFRLLSLPLL
jgi:hypothetical protein